MSESPIRALAILVFLLAVGTLILAMAIGGDILMVVFGLLLAATSMELLRRAQPTPDDED
jgi:small neutral amino acid transporter SnatA (MarC family)